MLSGMTTTKMLKQISKLVREAKRAREAGKADLAAALVAQAKAVSAELDAR